MYTLILVIYFILAVFIIALIMIQQNKGAEAGVLGGVGASDTLFGSSGSGNFLSRLTTICCVIFFLLSLLIANMNVNNIGKTKKTDQFENIVLPQGIDKPTNPSPGDKPTAPTLPTK